MNNNLYSRNHIKKPTRLDVSTLVHECGGSIVTFAPMLSWGDSASLGHLLQLFYRTVPKGPPDAGQYLLYFVVTFAVQTLKDGECSESTGKTAVLFQVPAW